VQQVINNAESDVSLTGRNCIYCSYRLDGLSASGVCPECGKPVVDSLKGLLLQFASPEYLREVKSGLSLYLNGILVQIVVMIIVAIAAFALAGNPTLVGLVTALGLIPAAMTIIGFWKYTAPDPGYVGQENPNSARQIARIALIFTAILSVASVFAQFTGTALQPGMPGGPGGGAAGAAMTAGAIIGILIALLGGIAWIVQFFAGLRYTSWMMGRIPDADLVARTKKYLWLLPVIYIVGSCVIIGPLIALVMFWNHLDKLCKYLKTLDIPAASGTMAMPQ